MTLREVLMLVSESICPALRSLHDVSSLSFLGTETLDSGDNYADSCHYIIFSHRIKRSVEKV